MNNDLKILIAVPSMDYVAAGFAQCLATLNKIGQCAVAFVCGSLIYDARNKLAAQALKMEADYVMWFDSDMTFAPDTMRQLLKTMEAHDDAGLVSGVYFRRSAPYTPVIFDTFDIVDGKAVWTDYEKDFDDSVVEVGGVGFGCVLVKSDVLIDCFGKYETCFSPIAKVGEDLSFCWRARELGYKTYVDTSVKCGHVGQVVVTEGLYKAVSGKGENK